MILVAGFSKSYSSLLSFLALPTRLKDVLKVAAPPYLYSGPSPIASLATTLVGLEVNDKRGDLARNEMHRKTHQVLRCLDELGIYTPNQSGYPVIEVPLARHEDIDAVGRFLFDRGIYVTHGRVPPGAEGRSRLPDPGHRGQRRRRDRPPVRRCSSSSTPASTYNTTTIARQQLEVVPPGSRRL